MRTQCLMELQVYVVGQFVCSGAYQVGRNGGIWWSRLLLLFIIGTVKCYIALIGDWVHLAWFPGLPSFLFFKISYHLTSHTILCYVSLSKCQCLSCSRLATVALYLCGNKGKNWNGEWILSMKCICCLVFCLGRRFRKWIFRCGICKPLRG